MLRRRRAQLAGALLLALVLAAAIAARAEPGGPAALALRGVRMMHALGPAGMAVVAVAQVAVALSGVLPASLVGLAAGAVYGVPAGFLLAAVSTLAGAWLAFRASRSLLRPRIAQWVARRPGLRRLEAGLAGEDWRLVCLLRASPVMPFALTSYALGLAAIAERDYLLGTLASLPALLGYVCLGWLARAGLAAGASGAGPIRWAMLVLALAATAGLTWRIGRLVARALAAGGNAAPGGSELSLR